MSRQNARPQAIVPQYQTTQQPLIYAPVQTNPLLLTARNAGYSHGYCYCVATWVRSAIRGQPVTLPSLASDGGRREFSPDAVTAGYCAELIATRFVINPSDRIAQMIIAKYEYVTFDEVAELSETRARPGGYGSTGNND